MYLFNTQHIISHNLARPATHVQHSSKNDVSYVDGGLFLSSFQIYEHWTWSIGTSKHMMHLSKYILKT